MFIKQIGKSLGKNVYVFDPDKHFGDISADVSYYDSNVPNCYKQLVEFINKNKNGEILAMSSRPTFDPTNYQAYSIETINRNLSIWSSFEPGSTFKILTFVFLSIIFYFLLLSIQSMSSALYV